MTLTELLNRLNMLDKKLKSNKDTLFKAVLMIIRDYLIEIFSVTNDELAIIMKDHEELGHFVLPFPFLNKSNTFPINRSTITRDVFLKGRPVMSNDAPSIHRLSFYEMIKISEKKPLPIQKFLAMPLIEEGNVFAVLWVSRRGATHENAGKDFTKEDMTNLGHLIKIINPFLYKSKPDKFL